MTGSLTAQKNNHLFIEVGGVGHFGTVNYEYIFLEKSTYHVGARVGATLLRLRDYNYKLNPDIVFPFGPTLTIGHNHRFEFDLLGIYSSTVYNTIPGNTARNNQFSAGSFLGYRFQPKDGKIVLRAGYTPILESLNRLRHWGGVSIGYQF